jgi:tricorn protease
MKYSVLPAGTLLALLSTVVDAQQTLLLRQPDVSADKIAFVYAGDIWLADRDGANPQRLTSHPAEENSPTFSPDGSQIAYKASYENNDDVYVVDVSGGQPQRLTWHPADDVPTGWTPDGTAVTFVSARETDHGRSGQLYHASLAGGLPEKQMEARVYRGVYDESGDQFAYIAFGSGYNGLFGGTSGWKGYRGGTTPEIQIMDMPANAVVTVPGAGVTNFNPMWLGDSLYFISDREDEIYNVFRYDADSGAVARISGEEVWDVRAAGAHVDTIVYESGGRLKSLDVTSGVSREIVVSINPDLPQLRTQWKSAGDTIQNADISPTGKRAIVTARGEVFTVPVDEGSTRNITNSGEVREYTAIWSPSGEQVAYITDSRSGQSLVIASQVGAGDVSTYELGPHFYQLMDWSEGDDARIIFQDNHLALHAIDVGSGDIDTISTGARRDQIEAALSPDGRWLAYTEEQANFHRDLMLYNFASGDRVALTDGLADVAAPAFSRDGAYLFFAASTNSGPTQVGLNMTSQERPYRAGLYAIVLAADGKSPLLPETGDEEGAAAEDADAEEEEDNGEEATETRIDLDGIQERVVALQVAERNYGNLRVAEDGNLYFVEFVQPGTSNEPPGSDAQEGNVLMRFDFDEKETGQVDADVSAFELSADGKVMILARADDSLATAEIGAEFEASPLNLEGVRVRVNPREEWAVIFDEAWRMEKEYFYDPNMHGLDWDAVYDRYRPLVDHVGRREDLSALIVEMIAEMQVGHNRTGGGDVHREQGTNTGLLGANLQIDDGRYQLARVYTGESWNPFLAAPLATPGNEARDGEYILAINGRELTDADNIWEYLQGTSGNQVTLRVGPSANGRSARDIVVEPTGSERILRLWHWVENNRRAVSEATDGRVGYVYLPNTAGAGYTFFNRMFFAQVDRDAVIVDERSNAGGQAANYITEVLSREHLSGWKDRDGQVFNTPAGAIHGPKVMLIDQDAGSGGDYLPYSFRTLGIGKLIGTRTWGGLIGIFANPLLIDGAVLQVPYFRFYDTNHEWTVENEGVAPDIEVALDPIATNGGRDSQLEAAIAEILSQLEDFVDPIPGEHPPYPTELGQ